MSIFYLIRHANNDWVGKAIAGWTPGVSLNAEGGEQAERLSRTLQRRGITHICSSPLERALETAAPVAKALGLQVEVHHALGEFQFGEWTGKRIDELDRDPRWRIFNTNRGGTRAPGGESMLETQTRIVTDLECLRAQHPRETVAVVSHGDPIRAALLYYLGMPIDFYARLEVAPASFSRVESEDWGVRVLSINEEA